VIQHVFTALRPRALQFHKLHGYAAFFIRIKKVAKESRCSVAAGAGSSFIINSSRAARGGNPSGVDGPQPNFGRLPCLPHLVFWSFCIINILRADRRGTSVSR